MIMLGAHPFVFVLIVFAIHKLDYCISELVAKNWFFKNNEQIFAMLFIVHLRFTIAAHAECRQTIHNNGQRIWLNDCSNTKLIKVRSTLAWSNYRRFIGVSVYVCRVCICICFVYFTDTQRFRLQFLWFGYNG